VSARCDNTSVGVIIADGYGNYLLFDRNTFPPGTAPPAGHVDGHGSYEDAARAEVQEETGLTVISLAYITGGWRDNKCRRAPGPAGTGHEWRVYLATVAGDLDPSPRETRNARWLNRDDMQSLACQTAWHAQGLRDEPGIEPVWVQWLADSGLVVMHPHSLAQIDRIAAGEAPCA